MNTLTSVLNNNLLKRVICRLFLYTVFGLFIPLLLIWCSLVIHFTFNESIRLLFILLYSLGSLFLLLLHKRIDRAVQIFAGASLVIALWFIFLPASNDRQWSADASRLPAITVNESKIAIKNFRHFKYKKGQISSPDFNERTFDLNSLIGTDMIISYWGGVRSVSHTFVSFRFKDGQNIAVSLEVRKEKDENFDPAKGIFKQYELIYIIGDERDLIPLRTKVRHEETFLYPMSLSIEHSKLFLLDIIKSANELHTNPRFYHSIGQNCTTTMIDHLNKIGVFHIPTSTKVFLNGISDYYAYELEGIPTDLPFDILKRCCYISEIGNALPLNDNFSSELRKVIEDRLQKERLNR